MTCCCCSVTQPCLTLCDPMDCSTQSFVISARQACLSFAVSQSLIKVLSVESVMPSSHLILSHLLLLLPSIFPSIRVFSNESGLCSGAQSIGASASASVLMNSGLISFRMDWLDLLAVQRTLRSLLQPNSKASVLWCSAFFKWSNSHIHT